MTDFKPGLYKHYKGGLYRALTLVAHHETRELMVVYVALAYPESRPQVRELDNKGADSWNDLVDTTSGAKVDLSKVKAGDRAVMRFKYVQP